MSRTVVFGSPDYTDYHTVETIIERAFKHLHTDAEPPHELASSGAVGAEQVAERWWAARGLPVVPAKEFDNPKTHLFLLSNFPDVVLLFGQSSFITYALDRCERYGLDYVHLEATNE